LSSDEDDDDEVLAPQTPSASAKDVVSASVLDTIDVCPDGKVLKPCDGLFVDVAALGDEEDWVRWVKAVVVTVGHQLRIGRKVSSVVSLSSVGLEEGAFGASSVATRSGHAVGPTDASVAVVLVIGSVSAVRAFLQLILALRMLVLVRRILALLVSRAALCLLSLVVPRHLGVGLTSCATRLCLQRCHKDPLLGAARSPMSTAIWTLSYSPRLH
jgi:hypothetical protein